MTSLGGLSGLLGYLRSGKSDESGSSGVSLGLIAGIGTTLLAYGVALGAYVVAIHVLADGRLHFFNLEIRWWYVAIAAFVVGWIANINYISLHRYYRDRLMESFMPDVGRAANDKMGAAREADRTPLHDMCDYASGAEGPYHLVNSNVVLLDSKITRYRGRGGDSFILSPLYCGSAATGWQQTHKFAGGSMTLSTAMAISGAAANPNTGAGGEGPTRGRALSFLMSMLNIRLGYWAKTVRSGKLNRLLPGRANFFIPGLWEVLGMHLDEKSGYLMLTDGGHFDNLAIYELIRRRTKVIVLFDGVADIGYRFKDFGSLAERIRTDFGATIDIDLDRLVPNHEATYPAAAKFAEAAFSVGRIQYSSGAEPGEGYLLYIKGTLVEGLPNDIYAYKAVNETFPDQSTADQVFDEKQFEAYRELGYQLTKRMILRAGELANSPASTPEDEWLRAAVGFLLPSQKRVRYGCLSDRRH